LYSISIEDIKYAYERYRKWFYPFWKPIIKNI